MRRVAIIPARGGSKRLPRKNILEIARKPMISYPILCAKESGLFERIIVSTEDAEIADIAQSFGAEIMDRSSDLAGDKVQVISVCYDVLKKLKAEEALPDLFCCLYATAAFLEPRDLVESEKKIHNTNADVVMGVSSYPLHPYKAMKEVNGRLVPAFPEQVKKQSQNYPDYVASNGTFYWADVKYFMENSDFYTARLSGYKIPNIRAPDVDTPEDYEMVKLLSNTMLKYKGKKDEL